MIAHHRNDDNRKRQGSGSFRKKMLLYFGLLFAASLLVSALTSLYGIPFTDYRGEYGLRRTQAFRELSLLADNEKDMLVHRINERRGDAASFCDSPLLRRIVDQVSLVVHANSQKELPSLLSALGASDQYRLLSKHISTIKQTYMVQYDRIRLADAATGLVIASSDEAERGLNLSGDASFENARTGEQAEVISVLKDPRSGNAYLAIYRIIRGENRFGAEDGIKAVLILYLKPEVFLKADELELGKTGEIVLVNENTQLLTPLRHPLPDGTVPKPLDFRMNTKAASLAAQGNEGMLVTEDYGGERVMVAFRHLRITSELGWGMVVKKGTAEVFEPIRKMMMYFILKAVILLLVVIGLTYAIATRLSQPLIKLGLVAKRVEEGDLDARAQVEGPGEVQILSRSFNSMVQKIQNWHAALEEQVEVRTEELVRLNEELADEIEERNTIEEALRASEVRFKELLETVHQVAIMLDRRGRVTFCNDFLLQLTGWTREEIIGRDWFDRFIPANNREQLRAFFLKALETRELAAHHENAIVTRRGELRSIVWDNTLLRSPDGSLIGTASLGWDVTEHRSLEEQLRHSQKMEAIGQLAGGVAHDFNNMLTVIIGNCEVIKRKTDPQDPKNHFLDQILTVADKAANLTHSLLAFSRKQMLHVHLFDLNDCVHGVEKLLTRVIGEDIECSLKLADTSVMVMADKGQMEQVLINLAANARDAMPAGGQLMIETRRVEFDDLSARLHGLENAGFYAVLEVSDTGCGMNETTRNKIFDPFFTTKDVGKGTGLGLAMAFGTVQQHGGYIDVYSEPGQGTIFKIYLPLVEEGQTLQQPVAADQPAPGGKETILVVEDNEEVRQSTTMILQEYGYHVVEAASGQEALACFQASTEMIDLVLLDVIMPQMNGKQVHDAMLQIKPDLKAIFTSGYAADYISKTLVLEEGLDLLQKPFTVVEMLRKVRETLDR